MNEYFLIHFTRYIHFVINMWSNYLLHHFIHYKITHCSSKLFMHIYVPFLINAPCFLCTLCYCVRCDIARICYRLEKSKLPHSAHCLCWLENCSSALTWWFIESCQKGAVGSWLYLCTVLIILHHINHFVSELILYLSFPNTKILQAVESHH